MKILAIGAHPDDIEIFMFGLLMLCKQRGDEVNCIIATDGSQGGKGIKDLKSKRYAETKKALDILCKPKLLNFPDGKLGLDTNHYNILYKNIKKINPNLIITHYRKDYHSDHKSLSKLVEYCAGHYIPVLFCDTMMGIKFEPDYYVDITKVFKQKLDAISNHTTQDPKRFSNLIEMMNSFRAAQCNAPLGHYAEGYKFKKSFPFSDIRSYLPPSLKILPFNINDQKGFL